MTMGTVVAAMMPDADTEFTRFVAYVSSFVLTIAYCMAVRRIWNLSVPTFNRQNRVINPRLIVSGVVVMIAVSILLSPIIDSMPAEYIDTVNSYIQGGFWPMLTTVVAAPLLEEYLFRGIIQKTITTQLGPLMGIIIGSLIFGIIHIVPQQVVYATCMGLILGSIYYLTGSLLSAITIHFVNNGLTALLYMIFGQTTGLEKEFLGDGTLWSMVYIVAVLIVSIATLYVVLEIRKREARTTPKQLPKEPSKESSKEPKQANSSEN